MSSSVSWKKSKPLNGLDPNTVRSPDGILGGEDPRSIHVLFRWLERLHINQRGDDSISMSELDGIPVVEEEGRLKPRCRGGFQPIPCSDFINWIPTALEDLEIKKIALWRSRDPPWHHEFVVVMFDPDDKYTDPNDIFLPNLSERVPIQKLVATGLTLRIDRGRRSPVPFGSRQIAVDVVEIMDPEADLGNCVEFWNARADHSGDVEFFPTMRDLAYFLMVTMVKLGEDYHLLHRNCWKFAARLFSLLTFYFFRCWKLSEDRPEVIWTRQKFGGFDGFGSIYRHLDTLRMEDVPRHQSPFRGLIDVLRDFREKSSSNSVKIFNHVWMASLSPALVRDLVDLDVSMIAINYSLANEENPVKLFEALYTLTRLAKEGDVIARGMLIISDIFERSAKYMQTCQWSEKSDRALIHTVINAFESLFSVKDDLVGSAFVKSGWILALPRVFNFYPDHFIIISLYFELQSIEAARSHFITTSVLRSIFNFIQVDQSRKDIHLQLPIVMIWNIASWSPSSRQALLGAGLGTTITKILRSGKALNDETLDYLVSLLKSLILVNSIQDGPSHSLIKKSAVDSLKDAGVFQALQENYPSVLLFHPSVGTQPLLDMVEEIASSPIHVMARLLRTHPEFVSKVMSYLVKEGIFGEEEVAAIQSIFPGVELSKYGFDMARDASDSAYTSAVVNIGDGDLQVDEEMAWWNADLRNACQRPGPGIFPSAVTDPLHDSEHSFLSVVVTPHIGPCEQRVDHNIKSVSSFTGTVQQPMTPPPMSNEMHTAIPHPHAFYWHNHDGANMLTPEDAYALLGIPENADESMLRAAFILQVQEFPVQAEKWREALSIIAKVRESERLGRFLEMVTNPADLVVPTPQDLPRGLYQLGNTCYLNSLLQYFYIIRDLRDAIAHSDIKIMEVDKPTDDDLERHRVGGRNVTRREIARAKKFIGHLADLFWQMEHYQTPSITPARELMNLALLTSKDEEDEESDKGGMDLSNNAFLAGERLSRFPNFESSNSTKPPSVPGKCQHDDTEVILESPKDSSKTSPQPISPNRSELSPPPEHARPSNRSRMTMLIPLDGDDAMTSDSRVGEGPSQKVTSLPVKNAEALEPIRKFGQQHDVFECMDNCIFQIETALLKFDESRDDKPNVVKRLFYGKIRQCILPGTEDQPSFGHNKEDLFSHLPVTVSDDGTDLYDGLSRYMDNIIEYQGRKARMKVSVVELPSILQIQLQRAQFDGETKQLYKSQAYVKFWETIYMDRFLETADPQKKLQSDAIQAELDACRDEIKVRTQNGEQGSMEAEELRVRAINLKKELESIWRDETEAPYELASVFIHDGPSPSWGHYFLYSRHLPECPDSWFKYNDSEVTKVSKNEVMADTMGSTANPYLLVFVRKGEEVIDTVKRVNIMMCHEKMREIK